jgi:hypothetical protein
LATSSIHSSDSGEGILEIDEPSRASQEVADDSGGGRTAMMVLVDGVERIMGGMKEGVGHGKGRMGGGHLALIMRMERSMGGKGARGIAETVSIPEKALAAAAVGLGVATAVKVLEASEARPKNKHESCYRAGSSLWRSMRSLRRR